MTPEPPAATTPAARLLPVVPLVASMVSLCIGSSYAKGLFPLVGSSGTTALRIGLSALLLVAVQRPWRWRIDRAAGGAVLFYGVVLACMNLCFYAALRTLPLGVAIAIEFLGPLGLALLASRRRRDLAWIALAAIGVLVLALPGRHGHADPVGVGFALLAALLWALYIVAGKRLGRQLPVARALCLGLCVASVIAVPAGIAEAGTALFRPDVLAAGAVVALLCSALPYSLELVALRQLPEEVFGVVVSLEPAIGALAALAILGERLATVQWLAIAAVVVASVAITLSRPADVKPMPVG